MKELPQSFIWSRHFKIKSRFRTTSTRNCKTSNSKFSIWPTVTTTTTTTTKVVLPLSKSHPSFSQWMQTWLRLANKPSSQTQYHHHHHHQRFHQRFHQCRLSSLRKTQAKLGNISQSQRRRLWPPQPHRSKSLPIVWPNLCCPWQKRENAP